MMMRVFLDTNVLVDTFSSTRPSHAASNEILRRAELRNIDIVLTGLTLINTLYALRTTGINGQKQRHFLGTVSSFATIASTDLPQLQAALHGDWTDYEDAVQYQAAITAGKTIWN